MTKREFERDLMAAKTLAVLVDDEQDFWTGYQRGLRRAYYGERFGTDCEHAAWMCMDEEGEDAARRARECGYRTGFSATLLANIQGGGTL